MNARAFWHRCQKEKEHSQVSRSPDREMGESQDEQELHLGEKEEDESRAGRRKSEHQSKGRRIPGRREMLAKRTFLEVKRTMSR